MTINKSQEQTLEKVSVWLETPCFAHGILYVAISRVSNPSNIKVHLTKVEGMPRFSIRNIVYKEVCTVFRIVYTGPDTNADIGFLIQTS